MSFNNNHALLISKLITKVWFFIIFIHTFVGIRTSIMEHNKDFLAQLQEREKTLIEELNAIRTLIKVYTGEGTVNSQTFDKPSASNQGIAFKGTLSWLDYTYYVLEAIGGKAKYAEVAKQAINANPTIDKKTVSNSIASKLSLLYKEGRIDAIKGRYKRDGYTYLIK